MDVIWSRLAAGGRLVKHWKLRASANRFDWQHRMDWTSLNVTASNLPKNLFEDPLLTRLYQLLLLFLTGRQMKEKNSRPLGQVIRFHLWPPGLNTLTPNTHATSDSESARCWHSSINLRAPHMETMSCSLELFFSFGLCITWILKVRPQQRRRHCAADNKDGCESSQSRKLQSCRFSGNLPETIGEAVGGLLPQQTERNVHVLGKEDGCGASFLVTLATSCVSFSRGENAASGANQEKGVLKKKNKGDKPPIFSISLDSKIKTVQHTEVHLLC